MHPQDTNAMHCQCNSPEVWRAVPGWEGFYSVSNHGRVRSDRKAKNSYPGLILHPSRNDWGRLYVQLRRDGRQFPRRIHQLVAAAFIGPRPSDLQTNHIDGNYLHNCPGNLEYLTDAEHKAHSVRLGLVAHGEQRPEARLTEADVHAIRLSTEPREVLAARYHMHVMSIAKVQRGELWKHVATPAKAFAARGQHERQPKLPVEAMRAIRESTAPSRQLAALYEVSVATINDIRSGRRWAHVT